MTGTSLKWRVFDLRVKWNVKISTYQSVNQPSISQILKCTHYWPFSSINQVLIWLVIAHFATFSCNKTRHTDYTDTSLFSHLTPVVFIHYLRTHQRWHLFLSQMQTDAYVCKSEKALKRKTRLDKIFVKYLIQNEKLAYWRLCRAWLLSSSSWYRLPLPLQSKHQQNINNINIRTNTAWSI